MFKRYILRIWSLQIDTIIIKRVRVRCVHCVIWSSIGYNAKVINLKSKYEYTISQTSLFVTVVKRRLFDHPLLILCL